MPTRKPKDRSRSKHADSSADHAPRAASESSPFDGVDETMIDDAPVTPPEDQPSLDLVPVNNTTGQHDVETVNAIVAMAGLSTHTQRAYRRWIVSFLTEINQIDKSEINLRVLRVTLVVNSLGPANLKLWLGQLKSRALGKQSIMQAKAAIVWVAQLMADIGRADYEVAHGLSRIKAPRAEVGQRQGTWLTQDEVRRLIRALPTSKRKNPSSISRNMAIIILMATCGLRRDEIVTATWDDLARQGRNVVLRVHGKGEKLRTVKLPDMAVIAIDAWKNYHPTPKGNSPIFTRIYKNGKVSDLPITDKAIWLFVIEAAENAGLPRVTPHDLRRSFARGAYEAGVSFELIRQSLGHSNIATTERYVNSVLELDRAATDIWAGLLDADEIP